MKRVPLIALFAPLLTALALAGRNGPDEEHTFGIAYSCAPGAGVLEVPRARQTLDRIAVVTCMVGNCAGGVSAAPLFNEGVPNVPDDVEVMRRTIVTDPGVLAQFTGAGSVLVDYSRFIVPNQASCIGGRIYVRYWYADITQPVTARFLTGFAAPEILSDGEMYRDGIPLVLGMDKFEDDPLDPIVAIRFQGRVDNTADYAVEVLTDKPLLASDWDITMYSNLRLWADGQIVTGRGREYGNEERDLQAYDGVLDFAGVSGFRREYGPIDPFWPKTQPNGSAVHWETDRIWGFVEGYWPGDYVDVSVTWTQSWSNDLYGHGYAFDYTFGLADIDLEVVAVKASGEIVQ